MKAVVKQSFTKAEVADKGFIYVTPSNFNCIEWAGVEVSGDEYYVEKAVSLGAIAKKSKEKSAKKEVK